MQKKSGFEPISYADLWFSTTNNSDIGYRNIRISVKKKWYRLASNNTNANTALL